MVDPSDITCAVADALHNKYKLSTAAFDGEQRGTFRMSRSNAMMRATEAMQDKAASMVASTSPHSMWYSGEWVQCDGSTAQSNPSTHSTLPTTRLPVTSSASQSTGFASRLAHGNYDRETSASGWSARTAANRRVNGHKATEDEASALLQALTTVSRSAANLTSMLYTGTEPWPQGGDSETICEYFEIGENPIVGAESAADYTWVYLDPVGTRGGQLAETRSWMSRTVNGR